MGNPDIPNGDDHEPKFPDFKIDKPEITPFIDHDDRLIIKDEGEYSKLPELPLGQVRLYAGKDNKHGKVVELRCRITDDTEESPGRFTEKTETVLTKDGRITYPAPEYIVEFILVVEGQEIAVTQREPASRSSIRLTADEGYTALSYKLDDFGQHRHFFSKRLGLETLKLETICY